ncbi:MAG TPA: arylamine N-acetyltransferase [Casimicrobiaceae bacterium]|jgi:N-hydroxyarylamine O-acetyltransferase|nr:arylamine N-acetyltransferase [Casimicrobiaceae bacterium]
MTVESAPTGTVDLDAYLRRIGYGGTLAPTLPALQALHLAHATHIPFENLDILLGRSIRLDLESLQAKLVAGGRGGYCFEQNTLLAAVLRAMGFDVTLLAARVRFGANRVLPRTHMTLSVRIDNTAWLADVGFGAAGLLLPIRFGDGAEVRQFAWTYRLAEEAGQWVLQSQRDGAWVDLYAFTLEPQLAVDFEVANHYVSTHPQSRFVQSLTAQRIEPEARHTLVNRDYSVDRGTETRRQTVGDDEELLELLAGTFGLSFPAGTRFRMPVATT